MQRYYEIAFLGAVMTLYSELLFLFRAPSGLVSSDAPQRSSQTLCGLRVELVHIRVDVLVNVEYIALLYHRGATHRLRSINSGLRTIRSVLVYGRSTHCGCQGILFGLLLVYLYAVGGFLGLTIVVRVLSVYGLFVKGSRVSSNL